MQVNDLTHHLRAGGMEVVGRGRLRFLRGRFITLRTPPPIVEIPMMGVGSSLNVAVAGSLVFYKLAGFS